MEKKTMKKIKQAGTTQSQPSPNPYKKAQAAVDRNNASSSAYNISEDAFRAKIMEIMGGMRVDFVRKWDPGKKGPGGKKG